MMNYTMRPYQTEDDYWRTRAFLREALRINGGRSMNWDVCRFDYWRWHVILNCREVPLSSVFFQWETNEGQLAAVMNADVVGEVFFQVHPSLSGPGLEEAMLAAAEQHLSAPTAQVRRKLRVWAYEGNTRREAMLAGCGYNRLEWFEYDRRRSMEQPIPEGKPAEGFTVRAMGIDDEPSRSWASWRAFHPDEPDEAYQGWEWYANVQRCPLYRRDLDIVSIAPDGEVAGFCTVWFDDSLRMGIFEPVGVRPEYHRRGLGSAMMAEGLRRLKHMGALTAHVGSYSDEAGGLYASMGFTEFDRFYPWEKVW
jgi:mycothiol synthase